MTKHDAAPADAHEWVTFEDPEEHRTWVFDITFLTSPWTCIFGRGCQGVLTGPAADLVQGCCSYGAHFTDEDDVARVEAASQKLTAQFWQFRRQGLSRGVVKTDNSGDRVTRMVDGACVFLNRPGWPTGPGCALHQQALADQERPLDAKPNVCWQLPLRREEAEDGNGHVTTTIRQWDRKHWGDGGSEFHWWCTQSSDAFVGAKRVYAELRDELVELTSQTAYDMLVDYITSRGAKTFLPHPAIRATRS